MLQGHINGTMLGKTIASRPSPCPLGGRVRAKAAPQVAPHFGTTLVNDLVFNGEGALNLPESLHLSSEWSNKLKWGVDLTALRDQVLSTDIILKGKGRMDHLLHSNLRFRVPEFKVPDIDFDHMSLIESGEKLNPHWGWDLITGMTHNLLV